MKESVNAGRLMGTNALDQRARCRARFTKFLRVQPSLTNPLSDNCPLVVPVFLLELGPVDRRNRG